MVEVVYNWVAILEGFAKGRQKWVLFLSTSEGSLTEILQAAPILTPEQAFNLLSVPIYLLYDTEEEMQYAYARVVGDAGPTKANAYTGPAKVFACTCSPYRGVLTNNT